MSSPSDSLRALPRYTPSPRRNKPDAAHKRLLGRRLRQLLVVVGAVGVLARRDARVLVVLLVRRRRVGGVVVRLGLGAVLLDHGREELLFLAFVLLEERRHARDLGLVVVPVEAREAVAVHLLEGFVVGGHGLLLGCDTLTRFWCAAGSLSQGGWGCARPETPGFVVAVLQRRRCDAQTTADESFARLREYSLGFWCSSPAGALAC